MNTIRKDIIDIQTIKGCQKYDPPCQRKLYDLSVGKLFNVVYRIVMDAHKTQDILQESFIKIFDKIQQYDENKGTIYAWMCKIAINQSINYLRRNRIVFEEISTIDFQDKEMTIIHTLEAESILQLIEKLPEQQRIIFNLYEIEGFNHEEIAALLNINGNTCRVYLSRAKTKMQELINEQNQNYLSKIVQ